MPSDNTPKDGDFAAYLARPDAVSNSKGSVSPQLQQTEVEQVHDSALPELRQSLQDVIAAAALAEPLMSIIFQELVSRLEFKH